MDFNRPFQLRSALPQPSSIKQFSVVIDYREVLERFFEDVTQVQIPLNTEGSYQERLLCMHDLDFLRMTITIIEKVITAGSYTSGISYMDIARLHRHPDVRRALYDGELHERFETIYRPEISGTEQYHLDSLEGAMTDVIQEFFGDSVRNTVRGEDDVILWRALMALVLLTARAVSYAGLEKGIQELTLMNYAIHEPHPYGKDLYVYLLTLEGP